MSGRQNVKHTSVKLLQIVINFVLLGFLVWGRGLRYGFEVWVWGMGSRWGFEVGVWGRGVISRFWAWSNLQLELPDPQNIDVILTLQSKRTIPTPQWGTADADIKDPSVESPEFKGSHFKAWNRSVYNHAYYAYCRGFLPCLSSTLPVHSPTFFSKPLPSFSCVGYG